MIKHEKYMNNTQTIYGTDFINTISSCKNYSFLSNIIFHLDDARKKSGIAKLIYISILFILLGFSVSLHIFWDRINVYFNLIKYDSTIFACQFASIITSVSLIISSVKRKDISN